MRASPQRLVKPRLRHFAQNPNAKTVATCDLRHILENLEQIFILSHNLHCSDFMTFWVREVNIDPEMRFI
jgi:hypothetical protein